MAKRCRHRKMQCSRPDRLGLLGCDGATKKERSCPNENRFAGKVSWPSRIVPSNNPQPSFCSGACTCRRLHGLDSEILMKGALWKCSSETSPVSSTGVFIIGNGSLPAKWVIHASGSSVPAPSVWRKQNPGKKALTVPPASGHNHCLKFRTGILEVRLKAATNKQPD